MDDYRDLKLFDGDQLRLLHGLLPEDSDATFTGAQVLDFVESKVSSVYFFGPSLPEHLKSSALKRLNFEVDDASFRQSQLSREEATNKLNDYITAIADELEDHPLAASILDGKTLQLLYEDEDDFAVLSENLFMDLDTEDKGKLSRSEIRNVLIHMGIEMGVPPLEGFPLINDILKKHGAEGEEELGQSQFAELLQPVLQDMAEALAEKPVAVIHNNIKVYNGSKLKRLLADEKRLNDVIEKILEEKHTGKGDQTSTQIIIKGYLEKKGEELDLPPYAANDAAVLLYDDVFTYAKQGTCDAEAEDEFRKLVIKILWRFMDELQEHPFLLCT